MRLSALLVKNFELAANLQDIYAKVDLVAIEQEDSLTFEHWIAKIAQQWVTDLTELISTIDIHKQKKLGLTDFHIEKMLDIISQYTQAQHGVFLTIKEFSKDHPDLIGKYNNLQIEPLTSDAALEHVYLNSQIKHEGFDYSINSMVFYDNVDAIDYINSFVSYEEKSNAKMQMIEGNFFFSCIDIGYKQDNRVTTLATLNSNIITSHTHSELISDLLDIVEKDYRILNKFTHQNASIIDFSKKCEWIADILTHCSQDNFTNGVTDESIVFFKRWVDSQQFEENITIDKGVLQTLHRISYKTKI